MWRTSLFKRAFYLYEKALNFNTLEFKNKFLFPFPEGDH